MHKKMLGEQNLTLFKEEFYAKGWYKLWIFSALVAVLVFSAYFIPSENNLILFTQAVLSAFAVTFLLIELSYSSKRTIRIQLANKDNESLTKLFEANAEVKSENGVLEITWRGENTLIPLIISGKSVEVVLNSTHGERAYINLDINGFKEKCRVLFLGIFSDSTHAILDFPLKSGETVTIKPKD